MKVATSVWKLPLLSGWILALAFPPLHLVAPAFLALVPLGVWIDGLPASGDGARTALRGGAILGASAWALLLAWIPPALMPWSWLAVPSYVMVVALLALVTGLATASIHHLRHRVRWPLWLACAVGWTAGEWLRGHLPGSLAFPWLGLGTSLTGFPEWVGAAEWVGARGITFWLAAIAGLLAMAVRGSGAARLRASIGAIALAFAIPVLGIWRSAELVPSEVARVAVVQPSVSQSVKRDPTLVASATFEALERLWERLDDVGVDLVVLPEAPFPDTVRVGRPSTVVDRVAGLAARAGAPVLMGGLGGGGAPVDGEGAPVDGEGAPVDGEGAPARGGGAPVDGESVFNSAFLIDGAGLTSFRYDKHHLVPLVERLPTVALPGGSAGDVGHAVGRGWPLVTLAEGSAGAMICFESSFPDVARSLRRVGADFLVNLTNDGWLGDGAGTPRTHGFSQHPAHLVMRAIETRSGVVRAANTGFSFVLTPTGRISSRLAPFEEAVLIDDVYTTSGPTLYVRTGDVFGGASVTSVILALLLTGAARMSRRTPEGPRHKLSDAG